MKTRLLSFTIGLLLLTVEVDYLAYVTGMGNKAFNWIQENAMCRNTKKRLIFVE